MAKYFLEIEYVGTNYSGWQIQDSAPSIEEAIETAIEKFCGEKTTTYSCGRTDAGVHAIKMPAHIDIFFIIFWKNLFFSYHLLGSKKICNFAV